jgi:hypothetical protein
MSLKKLMIPAVKRQQLAGNARQKLKPDMGIILI